MSSLGSCRRSQCRLRRASSGLGPGDAKKKERPGRDGPPPRQSATSGFNPCRRSALYQSRGPAGVYPRIPRRHLACDRATRSLQHFPALRRPAGCDLRRYWQQNLACRKTAACMSLTAQVEDRQSGRRGQAWRKGAHIRLQETQNRLRRRRSWSIAFTRLSPVGDKPAASNLGRRHYP